jgi:hypothetical protein
MPDGQLGITLDPKNTISAFAWPTIMRKAAEAFEQNALKSG